jgi:hypothetical protein
MQELGIDLLYSQSVMLWEDNQGCMKSHGMISRIECAQQIYCMHVEVTLLIQAAEKRKIKILESNYSLVDIAEHIAKLVMLSTIEKEIILGTLNDYPVLFSGGL